MPVDPIYGQPNWSGGNQYDYRRYMWHDDPMMAAKFPHMQEPAKPSFNFIKANLEALFYGLIVVGVVGVVVGAANFFYWYPQAGSFTLVTLAILGLGHIIRYLRITW